MAAALLVAWPVAAMAAGDGQQAAKAPDPKAGVVVEKVESGFVIGPDVKITRVNGRDATLVGGYGGILVDKALLIGGAGYWLSNGDRRLELAYGGGVVEWYLFSSHALDVSVRGLVGAGTARVAHGWSGVGDVPERLVSFGRHGSMMDVRPPVPGTGPSYLVYDTGFFIGEPQANLVWHAARWVTVSAGVSYRAIAAANGLEKDLRGASGSVAIRFGAGRR